MLTGDCSSGAECGLLWVLINGVRVNYVPHRDLPINVTERQRCAPIGAVFPATRCPNTMFSKAACPVLRSISSIWTGAWRDPSGFAA